MSKTPYQYLKNNITHTLNTPQTKYGFNMSNVKNPINQIPYNNSQELLKQNPPHQQANTFPIKSQ